MVVIGPCSIHDTEGGAGIRARLAEERERFAGDLEIVMRVYFEKPRTTVGWKGLINDPYMDNSFRINDGLRMAREMLLQINELGLPAGTEFLDVISPQYIADLSAGARSAPAPPSRRCTANWRRACPARSASRTAPTATSRSPSTPSRRRRSRTISCR
jgi:phospho-2-dehydro-3-deoxyheptonate aldolase